MAKSKKKTAKVYKKFKHFIAHLDTHDDLQGVVSGAQRKDIWAGYATALGAIESIASEGETTKKVKKRQRKAIQNLHKMAKHALGPQSVRPPTKKEKKNAQKAQAASSADTSNIVPIQTALNSVPDNLIRTEKQPAALRGPRRGGADDLKMIAGVGPKLEQMLHGLGIYHFDQIATWTPQEVMWIDDHLRFSGRIVREDWISQAAALAKGGRDEYVRVFGKEPR